MEKKSFSLLHSILSHWNWRWSCLIFFFIPFNNSQHLRVARRRRQHQKRGVHCTLAYESKSVYRYTSPSVLHIAHFPFSLPTYTQFARHASASTTIPSQ